LQFEINGRAAVTIKGWLVYWILWSFTYTSYIPFIMGVQQTSNT